MAPARGVTRRAYENDENATTGATMRLTRAKAAALTGPNDIAAADPPKKALAAKKQPVTAVGANGVTAQPARKRAALGDVSNVNKTENVEAKGTLAKGTLAKAQRPIGVQKPARSNSTRIALGQKNVNTNAGDLKRPASGSGITGHATKKRNTSVTKADSTQSGIESVENVPPPHTTANDLTRKLITSSTTPAFNDVMTEYEKREQIFDDICKDAKDLDVEDHEDPLMVAEYVHEIFDYMQELEQSTLPNPKYMESQTELEWKMRGILVDWLLEVHTRFRLLPETLFLAVNIIDRFLSRKVVQLDRLQLVGVTAMFIASKYEEVLSPHVQNFRHVADDGFSEAEILSAERYILAALDYDLSYPNPMNFLRRISKADNYDIQSRTLGKYLLEIGCLDHRFIKYPPSYVAAAAMYLARIVLERSDWDATLTKYSGYTEEEIQPVFKLMVDYLSGPVVHDAFFRKYASKKFLKASIVLRSWAKKWSPTYLDRPIANLAQGSHTPVL